MNSTTEVKLRDRRKPGHAWQDNELYDVFQPIVGPHAVNVYANLTRHCYGQTSVGYSLRKLAKATRMSAASVWRNLAVLESVGVLRMVKGKGSAKSSCELYDLKDAAEALGAVYDSRCSSFILPEEKVAEMCAKVAVVRQAMQGKQQPGGAAACVSQRDTKSKENFSAPEDQRVASVSGRVASVSLGGVPISVKEEEKIKTNPPPTPALPAGEVPQRDHVDDALEHLVRECGFADERLKKALRKSLLLWKSRNTGGAYDAAGAMIEAWRSYQQISEFLRGMPWGPRKFFCQGHWLKPESWPLDQKMLARVREARVGSC